MATNITLATFYRNKQIRSATTTARAAGQTTLVGGLGAIATGAITNSDVAKWVGAGVAAATAIIGYRATSAAADNAVEACLSDFASIQSAWERARRDPATVNAGFDAMVGQIGVLSQKRGCSQFAPDTAP